MPDILLHNFAASPFAEKVRLICGLKSIPWKSVEAELVMPKPDLTTLTGGYRKTPVMQIGSDIYCDSRLIAEELEDRYLQPTLFPYGSRGLCLALSSWSEKALHISSLGLTIGVNKKKFPESLMADRKRFFEGFMDVENLDAEVPHLKSQLRLHASLIEQQLSDGRQFWLGEAPSWADFHAYVEIWTVRAHVPLTKEILGTFHRMAEWEERVKTIGHGQKALATVEEAHEAARVSEASPGHGVDENEDLEASKGDFVAVTPDDYGKEPVVGRLVTLTLREVAVEREDDRVGKVTVHLPRTGYRIAKN